MNPRLFRLIETQARIDSRLRRERAQSLPNAFNLLQLEQLKLRAKGLIARFSLRPERI